MCEIMIGFTNCDVIHLYMTSRHTFWYKNVCKWIDSSCSKFGYYCFLLRMLKEHNVRYSKWSCWNIQASTDQYTYNQALTWWVGMCQGGQCSQNQILFKFSEYQLIPNTRYYVAIELYFRLGYANANP